MCELVAHNDAYRAVVQWSVRQQTRDSVKFHIGKVGKVDFIAPNRETSKALRDGSHSFTCNYTNACLYLVSVRQMALPLTGDNVRLIAAYFSSIDPEKGWVGLDGWPTADGLPM